MEQKVVLEMINISKSFPGVKALDQVSLTVHAGTVHALMGENGAGKSTLMKCAFGLYHPDEGIIRVDGQEVHLDNARNAMDQGIVMIHQELQPIRTRNVMENIWAGRVPYKKTGPIHWVDDKKMYRDTKELFEKFDLKIDPRMMMGELNASLCQMVEVVRAVSYDAKVIIMDEPTSSLTEVEAEKLFAIIRQLTKQGVAIIYISHKMDEILRISDEVTIMRDGRLVGTWPASEMDMQKMINNMVGRKMTNQFPEKIHTPRAEIMLEVRNLTSEDPKSFKNVSFSVRKGEVFGIGGLVGAQRTELMESIFGLRKISEGEIYIKGKKTKIRNTRDAIHNGMALLTEERRTSGIIPMLSITENMILANQTAHPEYYAVGKIFLRKQKRIRDTEQYVKALSIKTPTLDTQIQYLSGGNQQKVLFGRWILLDPDILILDEPTRGIDVGAKFEIYMLIENMVKEGKTVIMISSEMPELMGMSDRIMVMCEGHVSGILDREEVKDDKKIMMLSSTYKNDVVKEEVK